MPRGDRTGPMGMGPQSGRAAGACAGFDAPGFASAGRGGGRGWGRGFRGWFGRGVGGFGRRVSGWRGWGRAGDPNAVPETDVRGLEQQVRDLEASLERVRRQLGEMHKDSPEKD